MRLVGGFVLLAVAVAGFARWEAEESGTKSSLRAVHFASAGVAWAGGTNGVVIRSEDDGFLWQQCAVPAGAEKLDFRGVWGWDANHAVAMASGPGAGSRLYETSDGCAHWQAGLVNPEPAGFWDAIAFWDRQHGMLLGDPVQGRFVIMRTGDGGRHWVRDEGAGLGADPRGEGAFAASNSALALGRDGKSACFVTGGAGGGRVFRLEGGKWTAVRLPIAGFSVAFRDGRHGVAVGGDYQQPGQRDSTAAWTSDGGLSWTKAAKMPGGYRSAVAWDGGSRAWVAVGTNGSDVSHDDGKTWNEFDSAGWNALSLPWVVGAGGRIGRLSEY